MGFKIVGVIDIRRTDFSDKIETQHLTFYLTPPTRYGIIMYVRKRRRVSSFLLRLPIRPAESSRIV